MVSTERKPHHMQWRGLILTGFRKINKGGLTGQVLQSLQSWGWSSPSLRFLEVIIACTLIFMALVGIFLNVLLSCTDAQFVRDRMVPLRVISRHLPALESHFRHHNLSQPCHLLLTPGGTFRPLAPPSPPASSNYSPTTPINPECLLALIAGSLACSRDLSWF